MHYIDQDIVKTNYIQHTFRNWVWKMKKWKNEQSQECYVSNVAFGKSLNLAPLALFILFSPCGTNLLKCNTLLANFNVIMIGIGFCAIGPLA
jgi:hypothetical protein